MGEYTRASHARKTHCVDRVIGWNGSAGGGGQRTPIVDLRQSWLGTIACTPYSRGQRLSRLGQKSRYKVSK